MYTVPCYAILYITILCYPVLYIIREYYILFYSILFYSVILQHIIIWPFLGCQAGMAPSPYAPRLPVCGESQALSRFWASPVADRF